MTIKNIQWKIGEFCVNLLLMSNETLTIMY